MSQQEDAVGFDERSSAAMLACVNHARDLLDAAKAIHASGKPNIAYHLATLALEELGRRELIGLQCFAAKTTAVPTWFSKHTQDHVQKLFWAFFGANFLYAPITRESLEEMRFFAQAIHANRLAGLYVESNEDGLSIPSDAIPSEQSEHLIGLVNARFAMAENQSPRTDISQDDIDIQRWFLATSEDSEQRKYIFSKASMEKLAELQNSRAWIKWLKDLFDKARSEGFSAVQEELQRSRKLPSGRTKDKWKLRIRILCDSHSIRPKALAEWNANIRGIRLQSTKKNEILAEFLLGDDVPLEGLWWFSWAVARRFVVAMNIGTLGFWWWSLPGKSGGRFYEKIEDLERNDFEFSVSDSSIKVDWGSNRALTEEDMKRVSMCLAALPNANDVSRQKAYDYYIGGTTFLSINDIHWKCDVQAYGNFHESLKAMVKDANEWKSDATLEENFSSIIDELLPNMPSAERTRFLEVSRRFEPEDHSEITVTTAQVRLIKFLCDSFFLRKICPTVLAISGLPASTTPA